MGKKNGGRRPVGDALNALDKAIRERDVLELRRRASVGLPDGMRAQVWPLLAGVQDDDPGWPLCVLCCISLAGVNPCTRGRVGLPARMIPHRDQSVVEVDVIRSLHHWAPPGTDSAQLRSQLESMLNGVVTAHSGSVFYYQGLHDIAQVLLLVLGFETGFRVLSRLVVGPLRDCTRPDLDPVVRSLSLLQPILAAADPVLAAALADAGIPPYFAISWLITWLAHDIS